MLKRTMTYTDYNGNQVTDDFYFNLTKAEIIEMELSTDKAAGLEATINKLREEHNGKEIMDLFKKILRKSIGRKSVDGKRFIKNAASRLQELKKTSAEIQEKEEKKKARLLKRKQAREAAKAEKEAAKAKTKKTSSSTSKSSAAKKATDKKQVEEKPVSSENKTVKEKKTSSKKKES